MSTEAETAAAAAAAASAAAAKPWYDGVDAETIGHWDNKGWKKDDAKEIALAATKQAREALAQSCVPKDRATGIVAAVAKHLEGKAAADSAVNVAKLAEEKAALAKNWGTKFDFNHLQAMEGAKRLGITPEAVKALEGQI